MKPEPLMVGQVFEVPYPFVREVFQELSDDPEGESMFANVSSWKPGVRQMPEQTGNVYAEADGVGAQLLTIVSLHKPGLFPERVFYTRKWRDPDGKVFGKNGLHVRSVAQFRVRARGYRYPCSLATDRGVAV